MLKNLSTCILRLFSFAPSKTRSRIEKEYSQETEGQKPASEVLIDVHGSITAKGLRQLSENVVYNPVPIQPTQACDSAQGCEPSGRRL